VVVEMREAAMIRILLALCVGTLLLHTDRAGAQDYPNRPIKVVVPFPAGGATDVMARIVSEKLGQVIGQSIVIENRGGGAGGSVGAKAAAGADPDGYTILMTPGGALTTGPAVHKNLGYDPLKSFVPVGLIMETPQIVAVHPDLPVKTMAELIAYAKANPGKLSFGSQGFGVGPHLMLELLKLDTGINVVHVPYRGTAPMLAAILANEVQMVIDPSTTALPHVQAGKIRALAVTTKTRSSKLPDIPTTTEAGFPRLVSSFWLGVVAPAGVPRPIIDKLNAAFRDAGRSDEVRTRLARLGADPVSGTPEQFGKLIADELALWTHVVAAGNIKVE
jgi:tripartite-type tricarboxylate transporter receptor subunit TctC